MILNDNKQSPYFYLLLKMIISAPAIIISVTMDVRKFICDLHWKTPKNREPCSILTSRVQLTVNTGGERGIRTLGGTFVPHSLSRRAPSTSSAISPTFYLFFQQLSSIKNPASRIFQAYGGGSRIRTHVTSP